VAGTPVEHEPHLDSVGQQPLLNAPPQHRQRLGLPWARGLKNKNLSCDRYHFFMRESVLQHHLSDTLSVRALP
jgi:hypothetical protein